MGNKVGAKRIHWAEKLRVQTWYAAIRHRTDWTNSQFDKEFAYAVPQTPDKYRRGGPRVFEKIEKHSRVPPKYSYFRTMPALVRAVEQHPKFIGTAAIYESPLWSLMQNVSLKPEDLEGEINRLLTESKLVRIHPLKAFANANQWVHGHQPSAIADRCLRLTARTIDTPAALALTWCLYAESEPAFNHDFRSMYEVIADELFNEFFSLFFGQNSTQYVRAMAKLRSVRMDLSDRITGSYGRLEEIGRWPILPERYVGALTENQLFGELHTFLTP
jgi:hypothetical protein